ncbi:hypothetical protein [Corallococcus sp. AB045]|uniref:hypothetical protein n=1 Tax=Corallococcus sp. AB045 TaxID=2316719 RepID=UPI0011C3CD9D|nr:hypothetical protein [Corallococcus sp. AB045]
MGKILRHSLLTLNGRWKWFAEPYDAYIAAAKTGDWKKLFDAGQSYNCFQAVFVICCFALRHKAASLKIIEETLKGAYGDSETFVLECLGYFKLSDPVAPADRIAVGQVVWFAGKTGHDHVVLSLGDGLAASLWSGPQRNCLQVLPLSILNEWAEFKLGREFTLRTSTPVLFDRSSLSEVAKGYK